MSLRFSYIDHQGKGKAYVQALKEAGWTQVDWTEKADVCLADSDVTPLRRQKLTRIADRGTPIVLYPHSARPPFFYDFPGFEPHPGVVANFVSASGHLEYMQIIKYPKPVHVVGWSYCPVQPFSKPLALRNILFAPLHTNGQNWLSLEDKAMNQKVQDKLVAYVRKNPGTQLTVRYLKDIAGCGLQGEADVIYVRGEPNQSYDQIDKADLVVGTETFAYLAVARGKQTFMMDEGRAPRYGNNESDFGYVKSWERYKHLVMYPLDILRDDIECALEPDPEVIDWKERMIGRPFDPGLFVRTIVSFLGV